MTMNQRQQALLLSFLEEIYEAEQSLDLLSKRLISLPNYNPSLLFSSIASPHQKITPFSMQLYLRSRVPCNPRGLYDLFERFDSQRVGYISLSEFERELTPMGVEKKNYPSGQLTTEIETAFLAWVNESLHRLHVIQVARKEICLLSPADAFIDLDSQCTGLLGLDQLKRFFGKNDFNLSDAQQRFLLHGLRRRHYTHVNLQVFCQNLCPLQFGEYPGFAASMDSQAKQAQLSRSRCEEESMRLSRQHTHKLQHEHHRAERKRQAELEREMQFEHKLRQEMQARDLDQSIRLRKALLEEDRAVRYAPLAHLDEYQHQAYVPHADPRNTPPSKEYQHSFSPNQPYVGPQPQNKHPQIPQQHIPHHSPYKAYVGPQPQNKHAQIPYPHNLPSVSHLPPRLQYTSESAGSTLQKTADFQGKIQRQHIAEDKYKRSVDHHPYKNEHKYEGRLPQRTTQTFGRPQEEKYKRMYQEYRSPQQQRSLQDQHRSQEYRVQNSDKKSVQIYKNRANDLYSTPRDQIYTPNKIAEAESRMRGTVEKELDHTRLESNARRNPYGNALPNQPSFARNDPAFTRDKVPITKPQNVYGKYERQQPLQKYDYSDSYKRYGIGSEYKNR